MQHSLAKTRRDLHDEITSQLIATIESGPGQFTLPWRRDGAALHLPTNALTGNAYAGINVLTLWAAAARSHFAHHQWATYRQWTERGAQVRKGERASTIVFYKEFQGDPDLKQIDDDGRRRVARASAVFNAAQVDGFKPPAPLPLTANGELHHLSDVENFIVRTKADILYGGEQAYYDRRADRIHLPDRDRFIGSSTSTATEAYYSTALHELTHWSGAPARLNRSFGERFGDHAYAAEELVAEIAAAFLCAELQISNAVRLDHAQYLSGWLSLLKQDKRAIFIAAAKASEAVRYVSGLAAGPKR